MIFLILAEGIGGDVANDLQKSEITVLSLEECEDIWGGSNIDDTDHVCVGTIGQSGACNVSLCYSSKGCN